MKVVNLEDFQNTPAEGEETVVVVWWSGGITSAVATKMTLENAQPNEKVIILTTETGSHHPDHARFKKDCEEWYGQEIVELHHPKYTDHFDCLRRNRFINSPSGSKCTNALKQDVRKKWEKENTHHVSVWGFEAGKKEINRAERVRANQPHVKHKFPLIEAGLTKQDCLRIVLEAGISLPVMYRLGYNNSNCIACPKGGMAYWNKIRRDFPEHFRTMAELEREIGRTCLRKNGQSLYLDELDPSAGRNEKPLVADCGATGEGCEIGWLRDRL